MSKETDILKHMQKHKTIDPITAMKKYGCMRLAARIFDLRAKGHDIKPHSVTRDRATYAVYELL